MLLAGCLLGAAAPPSAAGNARGAILVAGIPGTVYGADRPVCGSFDVAALEKPLHGVAVSATGIDTAFSVTRVSATDACPRNAAAIARLGTVAASATKVYYRIAAGAFPAAGDTVNGTIRVASIDAVPATVDVPVTLRHAATAALAAALLWFVGLTVPSLIVAAIGVVSAVIGLYFYTRQKRIDQALADEARFRDYMSTNRDDVEHFFNGVYLQFCDVYNRNRGDRHAAGRWRSDLETQLREKNIWDNIPWSSRQSLLRELAGDSQETPDDIADRLSRLFPICAESIAPLSSIRIPDENAAARRP